MEPPPSSPGERPAPPPPVPSSSSTTTNGSSIPINLLCSNCTQPYDDSISSTYPRLLSCLHTFCTNCCQNLAHKDTGKNIVCPSCSYATDLTDNGIHELQTNYAIIRQVKLFKKSQSMNQSLICNNCDLEIAIWRCQNCEDGCANLCNECKIQHLQMKALRSHILIPMEEYKQSNVHTRDLFPCHKHPNEYLEVYCCDCQIALCLTCAVYDHQQHQRKTIDDGLLIEQHNIQQDITDVTDVYDVYEKETDSIEGISTSLSKQNDALKQNISSLFHELHELLNDR